MSLGGSINGRSYVAQPSTSLALSPHSSRAPPRRPHWAEPVPQCWGAVTGRAAGAECQIAGPVAGGIPGEVECVCLHLFPPHACWFSLRMPACSSTTTATRHTPGGDAEGGRRGVGDGHAIKCPPILASVFWGAHAAAAAAAIGGETAAAADAPGEFQRHTKYSETASRWEGLNVQELQHGVCMAPGLFTGHTVPVVPH